MKSQNNLFAYELHNINFVVTFLTQEQPWKKTEKALMEAFFFWSNLRMKPFQKGSAIV